MNMLINCKEMISSPNGDGTYNIQLLGCQFSNHEKIIEGNLTFQRVSKRGEDLFDIMKIEGNSEIFTLYIPE